MCRDTETYRMHVGIAWPHGPLRETWTTELETLSGLFELLEYLLFIYTSSFV